ncbi:MAG: TIGR01212 family radical SAM protein [Syntrophobacteraceae bacterium]|nr:TIGR01212 family radical SAM protein [Syntrophobacteraceae bacterium]
MNRLYRDYNSYLRDFFGCRVRKISLDAGLTCPNRDGTLGYGGCVYCNDRGSGTGAARSHSSITEQIQSAKSYLATRYKARKFLAYFQSFSNTYAPLTRLKALYEEALAVEDVVGLTIGTRPDCVPDEVLDCLQVISTRSPVWMEYGLQSAKDATLRAIGRGHSARDFVDAVLRTHQRGLPICAHVILGLPGETREDMMATSRFLASLPIDAVKIHLLYVVRGTVLEEWYRRGTYSCLSRDEYVSLVGEFLLYLPPHLIIQRLTGDPHPDELVAPAWAMEKQQNLQAILTYMEAKGFYQGKYYPG